MTQILVVNPNTTASMTRTIGDAARAAAANGTRVDAVNPTMGPESIEGYYDEVFSLPGLMDEIHKGEKAGYDGYVIACFDDTGLDAARCITDAPVVGICESAMHMATLLGGRFTVVTTLERSVPALVHLSQRYGMSDRCTVRASNIPVLELENPQSDARGVIAGHIRDAMDHDSAETIVLGCAGMANLADELSAEFGLPVLDGVSCAVKLIEGITGLGLKTSKVGGYATPRAKSYVGEFARFSPPPVSPDSDA